MQGLRKYSIWNSRLKSVKLTTYNEEQNKPTICRFIGKLGVLERGKTHPQNAASLFTFGMLFLKV